MFVFWVLLAAFLIYSLLPLVLLFVRLSRCAVLGTHFFLVFIHRHRNYLLFAYHLITLLTRFARLRFSIGARDPWITFDVSCKGTTERVCLIIGSMDGVMSVHNYIMDRIMEKPDPNPHATGEGRLNVERHKQVKILVPNSTAGMVIGKGGSYIQEIKDKTGAYVQISQKSREFNLFERCIIIAGDLDQTRSAVQLILAVIAADPQSASCPNLSYQDIRGPVASVYPTGSPYATPVVPCPTTSNWMATGGSPIDPTSANAAAMMAAMFSSGAVPTVGSTPGSRSSTFGFFSTNYSSSPDFASLALLASNQHALGLTPMIQSIALPSPGSTGAGELVGTSGTPYGSSPTQPTGFAGTGPLDPNSAMATRQAALLASIGTKPQLVQQDIPQLHDTSSPSTFLSQGGIVPPSSASSSLAAGMALAALSASAATGATNPCTGATQPMGVLPSPGALLGVVPSLSSTQTARSDQLSLAHPPSLLLALNEPSSRLPPATPGAQNTAAAVAAALGAAAAAAAASASSTTTSPTVTVPSTGPMIGLYALPSPNSSSLSASPVAPSVGSYLLCKKDIAVPESVIGLILGPQGRSIVDLQSTTGTVIQISQKGVYLTGTHNRLVTITGAQPNVQWAADVIEQRLQAERIRRESSSSTQPTPPSTGGPSGGTVPSDTELQRNLSLFYAQPAPTGLYTDTQMSNNPSIPITSGTPTLSTGLAAVTGSGGGSTVQPQTQQLASPPTSSLQSGKRENDTHGFQQPP